MRDLSTGSEVNFTSSVKRSSNDVGHVPVGFGKHPITYVEDICANKIGYVFYHFSGEAKRIIERKVSIENDKKTEISIKEVGENELDTENSNLLEEFNLVKNGFRGSKEKIKHFFTNDTVRHAAKLLLYIVAAALFIAGMFFPPVSAIAALTILGIAVTLFIFKAIHIIKQAKFESKLTEHKLIFGIETAFKILFAAAGILAFYFYGPLASLITQPISDIILGIMKACDAKEIAKRAYKDDKLMCICSSKLNNDAYEEVD